MDQPMYPLYTTCQSRLESYKDNWPKYFHTKPELLAPAGFLYTQMGDAVVCFWCGVVVKHWERSDIPWEEHRRHSPQCGYVKIAAPPSTHPVGRFRFGGNVALPGRAPVDEPHYKSSLFSGQQKPNVDKPENVGTAYSSFFPTEHAVKHDANPGSKKVGRELFSGGQEKWVFSTQTPPDSGTDLVADAMKLSGVNPDTQNSPTLFSSPAFGVDEADNKKTAEVLLGGSSDNCQTTLFSPEYMVNELT